MKSWTQCRNQKQRQHTGENHLAPKKVGKKIKQVKMQNVDRRTSQQHQKKIRNLEIGRKTAYLKQTKNTIIKPLGSAAV